MTVGPNALALENRYCSFVPMVKRGLSKRHTNTGIESDGSRGDDGGFFDLGADGYAGSDRRRAAGTHGRGAGGSGDLNAEIAIAERA